MKRQRMAEGAFVLYEDTHPFLSCDRCGYILCTLEEVYNEGTEVFEEAVYTYEFEIGDKLVSAYSATNPDEHRFDVVRVNKSAVGRGIKCRGVPTVHHSWFRGYAWNIANCMTCGQFLGWGFYPQKEYVSLDTSKNTIDPGVQNRQQINAIERDPDDLNKCSIGVQVSDEKIDWDPEFLGIIVTYAQYIRTTLEVYNKEVANACKRSKKNDVFHDKLDELMSELKELEDQHFANEAAGFIWMGQSNYKLRRLVEQFMDLTTIKIRKERELARLYLRVQLEPELQNLEPRLMQENAIIDPKVDDSEPQNIIENVPAAGSKKGVKKIGHNIKNDLEERTTDFGV